MILHSLAQICNHGVVALNMAASTTEAPLRAFSSPLVEADGDGDGAYFGYKWLEIVRGARGFSIRVDADYGTGICKITNLAPEVVDAVAASDDARLQFVQSGGLHHFLLLPGEYVTRVDVSSDGECILALRFVTTLRSSQWYGRTGVTAATTTSLVAPDGFIIKLLQGTQDDMRCLQLGVLYSPLATEPALDATPSGSVAFSGLRIPRAKHADHILDKPFKRFSPAMRAVVVNCVYDRVTSVHVLSASEFACYEATSEKLLRVVATEHFFVLVEGERMTGVACHYAKGGGVAGIRFRTTRRTSLWFGCMPYGQEVAPAWYPTEIRDGAYVCGFHGVETDDKLRAIGPVFFTPTRDATRLSAKGAVASGAA